MKLVVNEEVRKTIEEHFLFFKEESTKLVNPDEEYEINIIIDYNNSNNVRGRESKVCVKCPFMDECDWAMVILLGKEDWLWCKKVFNEVK